MKNEREYPISIRIQAWVVIVPSLLLLFYVLQDVSRSRSLSLFALVSILFCSSLVALGMRFISFVMPVILAAGVITLSLQYKLSISSLIPYAVFVLSLIAKEISDLRKGCRND